MEPSSVWVAHVDTFYRVVGVGVTQAEAIKVASARAWEFLRDRDCLTDETATPAKVAEFFGVSAVRVGVGEAVLYA